MTVDDLDDAHLLVDRADLRAGSLVAVSFSTKVIYNRNCPHTNNNALRLDLLGVYLLGREDWDEPETSTKARRDVPRSPAKRVKLSNV